MIIGPCNAIMGPCNVNMEPWNVIRGQSIANMGPRNVIV